MYACTLSEGRGSGAGEQEPRLLQHVSHSASASVNLGSALNPSSYSHPGTSPAVMMVSKHVDGSLNQVDPSMSAEATLCLCSFGIALLIRHGLLITTLQCFPVGGDVCRALRLLQRVDGVSQVPLLRPPLPFERPGLPHSAAAAADLLAPQRSAHASLGSRQHGRRAAADLPSPKGASKVKDKGMPENSFE